MRKDLRVGLGIGGVLLAVLVVAMVVKSRTHRTPQQLVKVTAPEKTDTGDGQPPPIDSITGSGSQTDGRDVQPGSPVSPLVTPPTGAQPVEPAKTDPFEAKGWDDALKNGTAMPGMVAVTRTPTRNHDPEPFSPSPEQPGPGGTHAGPLTPGPLGGGATEAGGPVTPPTRTAPPTGGSPRTHTIAQGETYSTIARTVYGNKKYYLAIEKANPGVDPQRLHAGQTIKLPELSASERAEHRATRSPGAATDGAAAAPVDSRSAYVVKSGDSLYRISVRLYGNASKVDAIYDANKDRIGPDRQRLKLGTTLKLPEPPTAR